MSLEPPRVRTIVALLALTALLGGLLAGCGSSSSTDSTESGVSTEDSSGGGDTSSTADDGALEALLKPYEEFPTEIAQTTPLKAKPTGKTVAYLNCSAPACATINQGIESATKKLGIKYIPIPSGGTPESFQAAAARAVQENPDVVIMAGVNGNLIKAQIDEMKAAGIKTINWSTEKDESNIFDTYYLGPEGYVDLGKATSAYALLNHVDPHVLFMNFSLVGAVLRYKEGIQEVLKEECPNCTFEEIETTGDDWGSGAVNKVVSVLQQNPDWEYQIIPGAGPMSLGVPQAIKAAGLNGEVCCSEGAAPNVYADLKSGTQEANLELDLELLGYYASDAAARLIVGEEPLADSEIPWYQLIDGKDITFDPNTETFHPLPDFETEFEEIWSGK